MVKKVDIENFKSLKHLKLNCKRINLFIGEPNVGKSNILEALGIFSWIRDVGDIRNFCRFESMTNLFYDEILDDSIKISLDDKILEIKFENEQFHGMCNEGKVHLFWFFCDYNGATHGTKYFKHSPIKFYRFPPRGETPRHESDFLLPPFGENLVAVVRAHKELKNMVRDMFDPSGLKVVYKRQQNIMEIYKEREDDAIAYPYSLVSDTLRRIIFYYTAIYSNKDSTLLFEEPEAHSFPYNTKYLAETIALDENNNQYFISTHNPYFLLSILEKSPMNEVTVFITYFEDYQTKVKPLDKGDIEEMMDKGIDAFFNIERFLRKKK